MALVCGRGRCSDRAGHRRDMLLELRSDSPRAVAAAAVRSGAGHAARCQDEGHERAGGATARTATRRSARHQRSERHQLVLAATTLASRPRAARSGLVLYVILALLFGLYEGINALVGLRGAGIAAWKPLVWEISSVVVILALIPFIVRFERHFRLDDRPRWRIVMAHTCAALPLSAVHVACMLALRKLAYAVVAQHYAFDSLAVQAFYELQKDLITYVLILVVIFANREFQVRRRSDLRAAELAAELGQARLKQLTAQIEPHFLFNTLNAISNRMHEDVQPADPMITSLAPLIPPP